MANRHFTLGFEVEGAKELSAGFDHTGKLLKNFSKPLIKSKDLLLKTWDKNFLTSGATIGEKWTPLTPSTIKEKVEKYGKRRILERTGKMRKSFDTKTTAESLYLWNTAEYFKYHQSNKPRKSKLPRRVMMKIDDKRRTKIIRYFTEYLQEVRSAFGKKK